MAQTYKHVLTLLSISLTDTGGHVVTAEPRRQLVTGFFLLALHFHNIMNGVVINNYISMHNHSLVPRPRPHKEEKGLVTIERYLGCAESAVLLLGKPIRLQFSYIPRDIYCNATCVRTRSNHCK